MNIIFEGSSEQKKITFSGTVPELFKKLKLQQNTALIARAGTLLTEDESLKNTDEVLIMSVISGG